MKYEVHKMTLLNAMSLSHTFTIEQTENTFKDTWNSLSEKIHFKNKLKFSHFWTDEKHKEVSDYK